MTNPSRQALFSGTEAPPEHLQLDLGKLGPWFAANIEGGKKEAREQALAMTAMCVGGMVLARAVDDSKLADQIRTAARNHVIEATGWREG